MYVTVIFLCFPEMLKFTLAKVSDDILSWRTLRVNGMKIIGMKLFSTQTGDRNRTDTRNINIEEIKTERQMSSAMRM